MGATTHNSGRLRLLQGGRHYQIRFGALRVTASPEHDPPFPVDAVAIEEDTYLVMSAAPVVREVDEHPIRLMTNALEMRPVTPGTVVVAGWRPVRLLAIVHDLDQVPTWQETWIARSLDAIFEEVERRHLGAISLPFLGTQHGNLKKRRFIELLRTSLERRVPACLHRLWLITATAVDRELLEILQPNASTEHP